MAWEKTWLFRVRDCYLVPWKLNGEAINVEDIPARAFDTAEEKQRVAEILEEYNNDLTLTAEEDAAFGADCEGAQCAASVADVFMDTGCASGDHLVYAAESSCCRFRGTFFR